jgi:anti-anti-sigma factor
VDLTTVDGNHRNRLTGHRPVSSRRGTAMEPLLGSVTILERAPGRFRITGEIDRATAPRLDELEDVHGPLLLDLHSVTFMDSSGIAALVQLSQRCPHHDCTFQVEACSSPVERVLQWPASMTPSPTTTPVAEPTPTGFR